MVDIEMQKAVPTAAKSKAVALSNLWSCSTMAAGDAVLRAVDERETLEASRLLVLWVVLLIFTHWQTRQ